MNDIDRIKLEVINNRLKYNELLELYIRYLKIRQRMMNKIPSYRNDYKYYVNSRNTNCYAYAFMQQTVTSFSQHKFYLIVVVSPIQPPIVIRSPCL